MNYKKLIILALLTVLSINTAFAGNAGDQDAISYLKEKKFMQTYNDGSFHEDALIRRADLLEIVENMLKINPDPENYKNCYNDVLSDWYAPYVCYAKQNEWLNTFENDYFHPLRVISKEEALKVLLPAFEITVIENNNDLDNYIYTAQYMNILEKFEKNEVLSRGELANFLFRILVLKDLQKVVFDTSLAFNFLNKKVNTDKSALGYCANVFNRLEGENYTDCIYRKINEIEEGKYFTVLEISDGDTFYINYFGKIERVRMLGIDTPELINKKTNESDCFAYEAKDELSKLISGKKVKIEIDETNKDRDMYDRLLRYIYLEDNTLVNQYLVDNGYAKFFENYPSKYSDIFKKGEEEAKRLDMGVWKCEE